MKALCAACTLAAVIVTQAAAQDVNLSGRYRCVQACRQGLVGNPAYVTQNGWDLNLLNEAGEPSRAWIRWPGRIWAELYNEGAIYSPSGITIQFDGGTIWQREVVPLLPRRR
jgi:hypothetical protein